MTNRRFIVQAFVIQAAVLSRRGHRPREADDTNPRLCLFGHTWDSTVAHYKDQYECHVLTLAGFAGEPRIEAPFLETVRKDLAAYIRENKMNKAVIVGHSLGGVMNPAATAESVKTQAEQIRKMYNGPPTAQGGRGCRESDGHQSGRFRDDHGWSRKSDHVAMGNAIFEMMTTDLRGGLDNITSPTLVLGTWIAYKQYATREEVEKNFRTQYAKVRSYDFVLFDEARHFVRLDDPDGFFQAVDRFLAVSFRSRAN